MITYIIAVIIAVLIVITILHDISIFRLERNVDMLQTFIDVTMRQLKDYALGQKSNADQHTQDVGSVKNVENNGDIIVRSNLEPFRVDEPQTITIVKGHGRKQALEMVDMYHKLKTEQTEREGE